MIPTGQPQHHANNNSNEEEPAVQDHCHQVTEWKGQRSAFFFHGA
jgi:hypothetical protein